MDQDPWIRMVRRSPTLWIRMVRQNPTYYIWIRMIKKTLCTIKTDLRYSILCKTPSGDLCKRCRNRVVCKRKRTPWGLLLYLGIRHISPRSALACSVLVEDKGRELRFLLRLLFLLLGRYMGFLASCLSLGSDHR